MVGAVPCPGRSGLSSFVHQDLNPDWLELPVPELVGRGNCLYRCSLDAFQYGACLVEVAPGADVSAPGEAVALLFRICK